MNIIVMAKHKDLKYVLVYSLFYSMSYKCICELKQCFQGKALIPKPSIEYRTLLLNISIY